MPDLHRHGSLVEGSLGVRAKSGSTALVSPRFSLDVKTWRRLATFMKLPPRFPGTVAGARHVCSASKSLPFGQEVKVRAAAFIWVAVWVFSGGFSDIAAAQTAALAGIVHVFGDSTRALSGVDLELTPSGRRVLSDSLGRFRFAGLVPREYTLLARRIGYEAVTMNVRTSVGAETGIQLAMPPTATALKTVTINGRQMTFPARYADAYARAARSTGRFFSREMIDNLHPFDIKSLLQTVPGVHVQDRGITFARCDGNVAIPSLLSRQSPRAGQESMSTAHVQVYVDGTRLTKYSSDQFNYDAEHALRDINPASIQLMEVYSGVARIPGEYLDDACAVILIWTK